MRRSELKDWMNHKGWEDSWFYAEAGKVGIEPVPLNLVPGNAEHVLNARIADLDDPTWIALIPSEPMVRAPTVKRINGFCKSSLIFGILGVFPLLFIGSILGVIFGIIGLTRVNENGTHTRGHGLAISGITIGAVAFVMWTIIFIASPPPDYGGGHMGSSPPDVRNYSSEMERAVQRYGRVLDDARTAAQVASQLSYVDVSRCPREFQIAYNDLLRAWRSLAEVDRQAVAVDRHYDSAEAFIEAFVRGYYGDPFGQAFEMYDDYRLIQRRYESAREAVEISTDRMARIAERYR